MLTLGVFLSCIVLSCGTTWRWAGRRRVPIDKLLKANEQIAANHLQILSGLAGYAIAAFALVLSNQSKTAPAGLPDALAMLVVSFLFFVSSGIMFAVIANLRGNIHERFSALWFTVTSSEYYLAVFLSWLSIDLLLQAYSVKWVQQIFLIMLIASILAGWLIMASTLYSTNGLPGRTCFLIPVLPLLLAFVYALTLHMTHHSPPTLISGGHPNVWIDDSILLFSVISFVVGMLGFSLTSMLRFVNQSKKVRCFFLKNDHRIAGVFTQVVLITIVFAWWSVAGWV